jgi:transposase
LGQGRIGSHVRLFRFWGAAPRLLVPDNLKSAIHKASFYDPEVNRTYADMAAHYGTAIIPARPYKPRDKAMASYCTLFGIWRTDGLEASGTGATAAAAFEDHLTWRHFP